MRAALLFLAVLSTTAVAIPEHVRAYAEGFHETLRRLVAADPGLLRESGLDRGKGLAATRLDFERSFPMYRIDGKGVEEATELGQVVTHTGHYYVPLCSDGRCPLMAAFSAGAPAGVGQGNGAAFVSVGQPKLTARLHAAEARLAAEPELNGGRGARVVEFPAAQLTFHAVHRSDGRDVLVPLSPAEAERMLGLVRNPDEVRANVTRRQKLHGFTVEHVREATKRLVETATPERPEPMPEHPAPSETKPINPGGGAVLDLKTPPTAAPPDAVHRMRDASTSMYRWARTPTNPKQEVETASSDVPGLAVLLLLGAVVVSGLLAWLLRRYQGVGR